MRRFFCVLIVLLFLTAAFSGCENSNFADDIDDVVGVMERGYDEYIDEHPPRPPAGSVAEAIEKMLEDYVSGLSTPPLSSIVSTVVDPADSQEFSEDVDTIVYNENELKDLILDAVRAAEKEVKFVIIGGWLTDELLYDIVFSRIHNVYMLDAFGLYSYSTTVTTSGSKGIYLLEFSYIDNCTQEDVLELRSMIDTRSKEIVRDLKLGGMSDFEKIETINGYLCDTVFYPQEPFIPHDFTPYGALFSGRAVCDGYARAAKILCDLAELDCYYVVGYCGGDPVNGGHAWNLVNVDGKWYQLDVTWNDCSSTDDFFLVTDDFMSLSREWDRSAYPASESVPYSVN